MGTGLIFAAVVALWAAYFVPLALRRYDEASQSGTIEKFSGSMRVVGSQSSVGNQPSVAEQPGAAEPLITVAGRVAARRRRRTLLSLLAATAVVGSLAAFAVVAVWAPAIPGGLVLGWLITCRIQVRRELGISRPRRTGSDQDADPDDEHTVIISGQVEDYEPHRRHVMERVPLSEDELVEQVVDAIPLTTTVGGSLWDPVPVTLPTYVTKARAGRTIRTIEFGEPDAWTSGHVDGEDTEMPVAAGETDTQHRRAVGD